MFLLDKRQTFPLSSGGNLWWTLFEIDKMFECSTEVEGGFGGGWVGGGNSYC